MDLNDKIKQILVDKSISPSHFADEIGVQRSSISHILAGRNRPSLDIIQKIIRRYPDLGMEWILDDEDFPNVSTIASSYETRNKADHIPKNPPVRNGLESSVEKVISTNTLRVNPELIAESHTTQKTVERILIFYNDGTFKQYIPDNS